MDTLEGIQRLFEQARNEPIQAFDVVAYVRGRIPPLEVRPPEPNPIIWKVSAAVSALAAVIPLVLFVETFLVLDDLMIEFLLPTQGVWLW
jgi:hypothetical protein